jgi:hypothetical protein
MSDLSQHDDTRQNELIMKEDRYDDECWWVKHTLNS